MVFKTSIFFYHPVWEMEHFYASETPECPSPITKSSPKQRADTVRNFVSIVFNSDFSLNIML
jgi:hypothetical protein